MINRGTGSKPQDLRFYRIEFQPASWHPVTNGPDRRREFLNCLRCVINRSPDVAISGCHQRTDGNTDRAGQSRDSVRLCTKRTVAGLTRNLAWRRMTAAEP